MSNDFSNLNAAGVSVEGTYVPDKLFDRDTITRMAIIDTGVLPRGALLGKITDGARTAVGAAGTPPPAGATITASPAATTLADVGIHRFRCATAGTTGKWDHYGPGGEKLGQATTGTAYTGGGLTLTITDSGTDPAVGEEFTVTVTEGAMPGKFVLSDASATDGSEVPDAILLEPVDATAADVSAAIAIAGRFAIQGVTFGPGHTPASVDRRLTGKGIYLENVVG